MRQEKTKELFGTTNLQKVIFSETLNPKKPSHPLGKYEALPCSTTNIHKFQFFSEKHEGNFPKYAGKYYMKEPEEVRRQL